MHTPGTVKLLLPPRQSRGNSLSISRGQTRSRFRGGRRIRKETSHSSTARRHTGSPGSTANTLRGFGCGCGVRAIEARGRRIQRTTQRYAVALATCLYERPGWPHGRNLLTVARRERQGGYLYAMSDGFVHKRIALR